MHVLYYLSLAAALLFIHAATGVHGDGDITKTDNLLSLQEHVFKGTGGQGVHFVMGDGVSRGCCGSV